MKCQNTGVFFLREGCLAQAWLITKETEIPEGESALLQGLYPPSLILIPQVESKSSWLLRSWGAHPRPGAWSRAGEQ